MTFIRQYFSTIKMALLSLSFLLSLGGCFEPDPNKPLQSTYWSLIELNGESSSNISSQPEVHLVFHTNDKTLHGSDGCNRIHGSYVQDEDTFRFKGIISTRMSCQEGMDQADAFQQVLVKTEQVRIEENQLILYAADVELARFEAKDDY